MRVLHLEAGKNLYGGAGQALTLMRGLARRDIASALVCPPDSEIAAVGRAQGLEVIAVPMSGDLDLGFIGRFRRVIDQLNPDLVHVHSRRGADTLGGLAARMAGVPAVLSRRVDSADPPVVGALKYRLYRRVVAISVAIRKQLTISGVPDAALGLVRDAIDADAFPPTWSLRRFRREFGLADTDSAVAVVAQLIERKGHRHLFKALTQFHQNAPDLKVILFGSGPLEKQLKKEVEHFGLQNVVRFAGFRADLRAFLAHFQLLIHPALREGLGLCLLEAQAAGVPVVGFRSGGVAEAIADGATGVLVQAGDTMALADAVGTLLNDSDRRHRLAAAGPGWVRKEFGVERMVQGYVDIYSQVLNGISERETVDDGA
jgi:glycosyltransferase involved in cell wall biosynthesis